VQGEHRISPIGAAELILTHALGHLFVVDQVHHRVEKFRFNRLTYVDALFDGVPSRSRPDAQSRSGAALGGLELKLKMNFIFNNAEGSQDTEISGNTMADRPADAAPDA
jgi:hypothetical protein